MILLNFLTLPNTVSDALENLEVMLSVIDTFGEELPTTCRNSAQESWSLFDPFIQKYGADYRICERTTRALRLGLNFFGLTVRPLLPSVLARMTAAFETSGFPSYLWIAGKLVGRFGNDEDPTARTAFQQVLERSSNKLVVLLHEKTPASIPDGGIGFQFPCQTVANTPS